MSGSCKCYGEIGARLWWVTLSRSDCSEKASLWRWHLNQHQMMGRRPCENWGSDGKRKSPAIGVNWCDSGRQTCKDEGQDWPPRCGPWSGVSRCMCKYIKGVFWGFLNNLLLSITSYFDICMFKLHFNVYLYSDVQYKPSYYAQCFFTGHC